MQKKVIAVGNSLAITIDASFARAAKLEEGSLVNLESVGTRLMLELSQHDPRSPKQMELNKRAESIKEVTMLLGLLDMYGLDFAQLDRLSYDGTPAMSIHGHASLGMPLHPITLLRLRRCVARQKAYREPLERTIETVLASTPNPLLVRRRARAPRTNAKGTCAWRAARIAAEKRRRARKQRTKRKNARRRSGRGGTTRERNNNA